MELPLKYRQLHPSAKKLKSTSSNSGPSGGKKAQHQTPEQKKKAQEQTKVNQTVLLILPSGKRRFVKKTGFRSTSATRVIRLIS